MKARLLSITTAFVLVAATIATAAETDYAESRYVDQWLRHPVYGDPSFDSFQRVPGNPICRGIKGLEWPVNGFLFLDPMSANWYIYVGEYGINYGNVPNCRCSVYRSADHGRSWKNLGVVLHGSPTTFDAGGGTT